MYLAYGGSATSGSATLAGINWYAGLPGFNSPFDPFAGVYLTGSSALTQPRGFTIAPATGVVWATDVALGLFAITPTGAANTWATTGPFVPVATESGYSGVAVSADGSTAFVTASKGIYGFAIGTSAWLSAAPLVPAPGTGANQVVFRGIALSPVSPSPSVTPSNSPTNTPSSSMTPSASLSYGISPSAAATTSPSPSNTPSASLSATDTPSPSATRTSTTTTTRSGSYTPTSTPTPSTSPFVVAQWDFASAGLGTTLGSGGGALTGVGGITATYSTTFFQIAPGSAQIGTGVAWPAQGTANGTAGVQFCASTIAFAPPFEVGYYLRYSTNAVTNLQLQWSAAGPGGPWTSVGAPFSYTGGSNAANGVWLYSGLTGITAPAAGGNAAFCLQIVLVFQPGTTTYVLQNGGAYTTTGGQLNFDASTLYGVPVTPTPTSSPALPPGAPRTSTWWRSTTRVWRGSPSSWSGRWSGARTAPTAST